MCTLREFMLGRSWFYAEGTEEEHREHREEKELAQRTQRRLRNAVDSRDGISIVELGVGAGD